MNGAAQEMAVEELYLRHHRALRRYLAGILRNEECAAEVAQETFLRLLRFVPRQAMDDSKAYLFRVAANAARDRLARERTRDGVIDRHAAAEGEASQAPSAETAAHDRERLRLLSAAIDELPERCREVFLMSRLDGLGNAEIAARLGISRNMVEKHIIKAMMLCRRRLDAAGG